MPPPFLLLRNAGERSPWRRALVAVLVLGAIVAGGCERREVDGDFFRDATASSGLDSYRGMTHGAAWGDFDGDGLPDLYLTNHLRDAQLFRNLGGGKFADVTAKYFSAPDLKGDKHGAAWADFDNDGRLDLAQLTGAGQGVGAQPKRLFRNLGDRFEEVAGPMGVLNPEGRTRMPLWLELDRDGRLDLFQGAEARLDEKSPPFAFLQGNGGFDVAGQALAFRGRGAPFCMLAEVTGDDRPELVCRLMGKGGAVQVFDISSLPAKTLDLLPQTAFEDLAAADFDNDGRMDLFMARKNPPETVALARPGERELLASVQLDKDTASQAAGFSFRAKGVIDVRVAPASPIDAITPARIQLGAKGEHPAELGFRVNPEVGAMAAHEPGAAAGVYIGFTAPDRWDVRVTAPRDALATGRPRQQDVQLRITAAAPMDKLQAMPDVQAEEAPARLFMSRDGKLVEESEKRGINRRTVAGVNVVAADFDNDMDVDLFILASGDIGAQESLLLLNDGKGHFQVVKGAGGASGPLAGVADAVAAADFDGDGYLDILVASGSSMGRSLGLPSDGGSYRLYRNIGSGNHWIELDLEGTRSNRDGIGAVVRLTAGGVTQTRVQDGGVHHRAQNHSRLHFGLAKHVQVDRITVHWPSGQVQELQAVKADQVLRIKEPAAIR